jgi:RNA polymerase subunit RPABC4/transcription elongation factor Spt4
MFQFDAEQTSSLLLVLTVYGGVVLAAFWLAMILWTYRDMRARSRDRMAQLLVAVMVAVLNFPGLLIYILLRPRETLSEAYERSLEEEALLQEIEAKPTCPGCGQRTQHDWQVCPHCQTRLKKACLGCGRMLELSWNICPHCATLQAVYPNIETTPSLSYSQTTATTSERARRRTSTERAVPQSNTGTNLSNSSLEFVEGE